MGLKGGFHMFQLLFGVLILAVGGILIWFGGQQANEGWKKIHYKDTNKESVDIQFISTLFFHKSDKRPLDDHLHEDGRLKFGGAQFDIKLLNFMSNRIEQDQELNKAEFNKDSKKIEEFYYDLVFIKLFSRFFWMYADWWDIRINSVRRGNSLLSAVHPITQEQAFDKLKWANFLEALDDKNNFKKLLSDYSKDFWIQEMTVPPKTKVDLILTSNYRRTLVLTNPFASVSISINFSGGSIGLGDYRWLLGYDNKRSNEFWSEHFEVNCKAKFEKSRSGYPEMTRYKQWVDTMFAEVQYLLDEKEQLKRAHEYRDLIKP